LPSSASDVEFVDKKKLLGKGYFGEVYKVRARRDGTLYALKKVAKRLLMRHNLMDQMRREIRILYGLEHPNIIKLVFHFETSTDVYLGMEYADGGGLFQKLKSKGKFSNEVAARYVNDVLSALSYLHNLPQKVIHRDIKPENILIDKNDRVKLCDFGWSNELTAKTRTTFCGTLEYLAPEMIRGEGHDERLDCWAIGVLLYECLTGRSPFGSRTQDETCRKILKGDVFFPPTMDSDAIDMIKKLLQPQAQRMSVARALKHPFLAKFCDKTPEVVAAQPRCSMGAAAGEKARLEARLDALVVERDRLAVEVRTLRVELQETKSEAEDLKAGSQQLRDDLQQVREQLTISDTALGETRRALDDAQWELRRFAADSAALAATKADLQAANRGLIAAKAECEQAQAEAASTRSCSEVVQDELTWHQRELAAAKGKVELLRAELSKQRQDHLKTEQQLKAQLAAAEVRLECARSDGDQGGVEQVARQVVAALDDTRRLFRARGACVEENQSLANQVLELEKQLALQHRSVEDARSAVIDEQRQLHAQKLSEMRMQAESIVADGQQSLLLQAAEHAQKLAAAERCANVIDDSQAEVALWRHRCEAAEQNQKLLAVTNQALVRSQQTAAEHRAAVTKRVNGLELQLGEFRARALKAEDDLSGYQAAGLPDLSSLDPIKREVVSAAMQKFVAQLG